MRPAILTSLLMTLTAAAQPAIVSIDPASAPSGERVAISGSGFAGLTQVRFRDTPATFVIASDGCVIASVPPGASSGPVTVTAGDSTSAGVRFVVEPSYRQDIEYPDQLPRPPLEFMRFRRPDGTRVAYFAAGDRYLELGFALLDRYWSPLPDTSPALPRGHLKHFLPTPLKELGHEPSEALMRHFARSFFARQHPETGLVPFSTSSWDRFAGQEPGGELHGYLALQVTEHFLRWFPDDPELLARSARLAGAMRRSFDGCGGEAGCGIHSAVEAETGRPVNSITRVADFGAVGSVVTQIGRRTGDPSLEEWAWRKQEFIWAHRLHPELPLLADHYSLHGLVIMDGEDASSDSDSLYNMRRLYEMHAFTGDRRYLERALLVTDFWFERAWHPEWGHFIRKLAPDGSHATENLYGDAMYNTLWVLLHAYRNTGRQAYLDRVKLAWRNLVSIGVDGFPPRHLQRSGMWEERGVARTQSNFIDILLEAYDVSGDSEFLCEAERHAETILAQPEVAMPNPGTRGSAGGALLRLARTRSPVERLEVRLPGPSRLRVETSGGAALLDTPVDADLGVIYVPQGDYRVLVNGRRVTPNKILASRSQ